MSTVIDGEPVVWIASYPRSGNTFLRIILWHCLGLRSASRYPRDLSGNQQLEKYVGHIEHQQGRIIFADGAIPLVKTHGHDRDDNRAIYVIRDGRAACVSSWVFNNRKEIPIEEFLEGRKFRYGPWGDHVRSWHPWDRPRTLLLEYEELRNNLPSVLTKLADFLGREVISRSIPHRNTIAQIDGKCVTRQSDWRAVLSGPPQEKRERFGLDRGDRSWRSASRPITAGGTASVG